MAVALLKDGSTAFKGLKNMPHALLLRAENITAETVHFINTVLKI